MPVICFRRLVFVVLVSCIVHAAQFPVAVGLVTEAGKNARIQRADSQTTLPTYAGDLIFPGDTLLANGTALTISFCPEGQSYATTSGQMNIEASRVLLNGKQLKPAPVRMVCELPAITYRTYRDVRTGADRVQVSTSSSQPSLQPAATPQNAVLSRLDDLLKSRPADLTALTARAIELERLQNFDAAAEDYKAINDIAPQALWAADQMRAVLAQRDRLASGQGKIIGVVIGISEYANLKVSENLSFADRDAAYFYDFLTSPRGGARPIDVALLLNDKAKLADITLAIDAAFARAKPQDQVVLYVAAHGVPVSTNENSGAYIMAYDSNQEEPSSMYAMEGLQEVTDDRLRPHQIQVFADTCHAAFIGGTDTRRENLFLADFLSKRRATTKVLGLLASGETQPSYECSNLDQGHGAFTYFLVHGLNSDGEAVDDAMRQITVYSLFEYVRANVVQATKGQRPHQTPEKRSANVNDSEILARVELPGAALGADSQPLQTCDSARGLPPKTPSSFPEAGGLLDQSSQKIAEQLNAGQEVIVRYLKGEQVAMTRTDFAHCEASFAAASKLQGGSSPFTEARLLFCTGRKFIFDKRLPEATSMLERAIRRDPLGAYSYNALGIAFLEASEYKRAIAAFRDAVRLAPNWAYARHNLALALAQDGQYAPAVATYREAMRLGPQYAYIPFNLGLLYERLNQPVEARAAWREALAATPGMARAWAAIGVSYSLEGRPKNAEAAYRTALSIANEQTDRLAVRHDLALLLDKQDRAGEAISLWRQNLRETPDDLPSLVGLSDTLYRRGDLKEARVTFAELLNRKPDYAGARLQYARLLLQSGMKGDAAEQLRIFLETAPDNGEASEMLADLRATGVSGGTPDRASVLELYARALKNANTRSQRLRIEKKRREYESR